MRVARAVHLGAILFGPDAATDGQTWSAQELAEFLRRKGAIKSMNEVRAMPGGEGCLVGNSANPSEGASATVVRMASIQAAATAADEYQRAKRPAYYWGRFCITGDETLVASIKKALVG